MKQHTRRQALGLMGSLSLMGLAALAGCGGGGGNSPAKVNRPTATPAPTAAAAPTPTTSVPEVVTVTAISTFGDFDCATGQYTQTSGSFDRLRGTLLPPSTNPVDPPEPDPTPDPSSGVTVFSGTYTLDSGEAGEFIFTALPGDSGAGVDAPPELFRFQGNPELVSSGDATVTLSISGSTGTGTIQLSNNDSGTIAITSSVGSVARAQALRQRMARVQSMRTQARTLRR